MRDAKRPGKVYSKWRYVPEVDAFFGITNVDLGFVLYRLDRSAAAPAPAVLHTVAADSPQQPPAPAPAGAPKVRAPHDGEKVIPLEIAESADWRRVCATAVLCDPMGEGEMLYHAKVVASGPPQRDGSWRNVSQTFNHPQAKLAQADPEIGGLRFPFPSNTGSGAAGNFKTNFSPDY